MNPHCYNSRTATEFHPYKIIVQEPQERDWHERQAVCERMLANVARGRLFCNDKAHFHLSGFVNRQNFRYRAEANPRQHHEWPLHSLWVTVWCAVADFGNIGPYFFFRKKDARWQFILTAMLRCSGTFYGPGSMIMEMDPCGFKMEPLLIRQKFLGEFWDNWFQAVSSHYKVIFSGELVHLTCLLAISFFEDTWSLKSFEGSHRWSRHWRTPLALQQYHRKWFAEQCGASLCDYSSASKLNIWKTSSSKPTKNVSELV